MGTLELLEEICALVDAGKEIPDELMVELDKLIDSGEIETFAGVPRSSGEQSDRGRS